MAKVKKVTPKKKASPKKVVPKQTRKKGGNNKLAGRIQRAEDLAWDEPFSIGIFGGPGTGKTTLWSTFPKPILALICSGELKSPNELKSIDPKDRQGIDTVNLENCEEINQVSEIVDEGGYKTVVLDHMTSFSDLVLKQVLKVDKIAPQLSWGTAEQQQWGEHGLLCKTFLKTLIDLDAYTVVVSQERYFEPPRDSELGRGVYGPATTPTIAGWMVPAMDYSIQMAIRNETKTKIMNVKGKEIEERVKTGNREFVAYCRLDPGRMTKFRFPRSLVDKVPDAIINPTFQKLNDLIQKGL